MKRFKLKLNINLSDKALSRVRTFCGFAVLSCNIASINMLSRVYVPQRREVDNYNVYSENELVLDADERKNTIINLENELHVQIPDSNDNYFLLDAILKNKYLNAEEKEIFYKYIDYFNDNKYLDKEKVYRTLLNVDSQECIRFLGLVSSRILACYVPSYNDIIYYETPTDLTIAHEQGHCIGCCDAYWLTEGMNQLIVNEYMASDHFGKSTSYLFETNFVKLMCELVGADKVLEAYTKNDLNIIYKSLERICYDEETAKHVIDIMNNFFKKLSACSVSHHEITYQDFLTDEEIIEFYWARVCFDGYVKTTTPTDENALDFLYNEFTCNVVEFKTIDKVLEKAYISSKLKKQGFNIGIIEDVMTYNDKEYSLIKK